MIQQYRAKIVSGFPGIGKSTLFHNPGHLTLLDSDSTNFSWSDKGKRERHPEWPRNYIDHIRGNGDNADIIMVSTHAATVDALIEACMPFVLVYPDLEMKDEYIARYVVRGNESAFVELIQKNYKEWITKLMERGGCEHVVLQPGQYLSDVVGRIVNPTKVKRP